jgi:hypothetical protein
MEAAMPAPFFNSLLYDKVLRSIDPELAKTAFVPGQAMGVDPSQGGDPAAAGGDPSQGGAPPPDPAAGGMGGDPMGGDPSQGGAPPPDPAAGGGAPPQIDPATAQAIQMAVQQAMGGAGGKGPGGGKKAEQQLLDTKLWILQYIVVMIAQHLKLQLPPSVVIGPPPDPMAMQAAQQDQQSASGAGAPAPDPSAGAPKMAGLLDTLNPAPAGLMDTLNPAPASLQELLAF